MDSTIVPNMTIRENATLASLPWISHMGWIDLTKDGIAVIMTSSELPEIIGACDRIIVLYEGKKMREFTYGEEVTQEEIMKSAAGA